MSFSRWCYGTSLFLSDWHNLWIYLKVSIFHLSLPLSEVSPLTLTIASYASRVIGASLLPRSVVLPPAALGLWALPLCAGCPELQQEQGARIMQGTSAMSSVIRLCAPLLQQGAKVLGTFMAGGMEVPGPTAAAAWLPVAMGTAVARRPEL